MINRPIRIAVVHDWLYTLGGAERVLQGILACCPTADLFCLFDVLPEADRRQIGYSKSVGSFLQRMPFIARRHRMYLPLMPIAIEQLDLRGYDLIISSSYAVAKGVLTGPDQLHLSYVHSPMRYAWDLQHQYLAESNLQRGIKSVLARWLLHHLRIWDVRTASGVDHYMTNSQFVGRRIRKLYGREAEVIYPPVDVPVAMRPVAKENFFLAASRLVAYKNIRAIVEAFRDLPDQCLRVVGTGPELARLRKVAGPNVEFLGFVEDAEMQRLMGAARALVFAAEEDFGIVPVEAQAAGTPVIALGRGGVCETVVTRGAQRTGLFFDTPEPAEIAQSVRQFIAEEAEYSPQACHANARRFAAERFSRAFAARVAALTAELQQRHLAPVAEPWPASGEPRSGPRLLPSGLPAVQVPEMAP